jgi:tight adherence protein B
MFFAVVIGGAVALGIFLIFFGLSLKYSPRALRLPDVYEQRILDEQTAEEIFKQQQKAEKDAARNPLMRVLDRLAAPVLRRPIAEKIDLALIKADLPLSISEALGIWLMTPFVLFVLVFLLNGNLIVSILIWVFGALLLPAFVYIRKDRRERAIQNQLPDTVTLLANALKGGQGAIQAIQGVASTMQPPIAEEFRRVDIDMRLGVPLLDAMEKVAIRIGSPDFSLLVTALQVQKDTGGSLYEILGIIADTMRQRIRLKGQIRVLTGQVRMSGYVITALPFALTALLMVLAPSYMGKIFTNVIGYILIGLSLFMMAIGGYLISRITKIEF